MPLDNIQAQNPGIRFPTVIGGNTDALNPDFPVVNIHQVKGGLTPFDSITQRDAYTGAGRQWGMIAYVTNDPEHPDYDANYPTPAWFYLENKDTNNLENNANWTQFLLGTQKVFRAIIGDDETLDFSIVHGCNDVSPNVVCYHVDTGNIATPNVQVTGANSIILSFIYPPQTNNIRVKVTGD